LDREVEPSQHVRLPAVREMHAGEADAEPACRQMRGILWLGQRLDSFEPRETAARRSERTLAEVRDPAERLERPDELKQERLEEHELTDRQIAGDHLPAAEEDDGRDRQRRQVVEARQMPRLDA